MRATAAPAAAAASFGAGCAIWLCIWKNAGSSMSTGPGGQAVG